MPTTTISIESINLPGLILADDVSHTGVRSDVAKTLSGGMVIWETQEPSGRLIDLVGGDDFGWLERSDLQSLQALASVPGATYTLTTPTEIMTVRFRNENAPAIEASAIIERPNPASGDWYNKIRIKLMEV